MNSLRLLFYFPLSTRVSRGLCSLRLPRQPEPCRCPAARPLPAVGLPCHQTAAQPLAPRPPRSAAAPTPLRPAARPAALPLRCPTASQLSVHQPSSPAAPPPRRPTALPPAPVPRPLPEQSDGLLSGWHGALLRRPATRCALRSESRSDPNPATGSAAHKQRCSKQNLLTEPRNWSLH